MPDAVRARLRRALLAVVVAGLAGAVAVTMAYASTARSVKVSEYRIGASKRAAHGKVTFAVENTGYNMHELVVIRTSRDAAKLPVSNRRASEKGAVDKVRDVAPGRSKRLTVNLRKGHYVLICNIPGHYKAGMRANLTVS